MQIREAAKVQNRQTTWYVIGDSGTEYIVHNKRNAVSHHKVWTCNCPDFTERRQFKNQECKHILEVRNFVNLKVAAQAAEVALNINIYGDSVPAVKDVLDLVVKTLNGKNGKQLWQVLTALRGPDNGHTEMKNITTAEIRGALGIKGYYTGAITHTNGAFGKEIDSDLHSEIFSTLKRKFGSAAVEYHFVDHYADALKALKELGYIK
jgi:hypothetical protein